MYCTSIYTHVMCILYYHRDVRPLREANGNLCALRYHLTSNVAFDLHFFDSVMLFT